LKGEGYNTDTLSSYAGKLNALNKEKESAIDIIEEQKLEIFNLKKKQKNYKLVIGLILFICVSGIVFISTINSRNATIQRLENQNYEQEQTILSNKIEIEGLNDTILRRNAKIYNLKIEKQDLEQNRDSLLQCNYTLISENTSLTNYNEDLKRTLNKTEKKLEDSNKKISSLNKDNEKLTKENSQLKKSKLEPEKYKVYGKSNYYAETYYINSSNRMIKTGVSFKDNTIVYVYKKYDQYALTDKGYFKLEDLRKL
jgi:hypothetical protein